MMSPSRPMVQRSAALMMFLLFTGCASYEPAKHPDPAASSGEISKEIVATADSIELRLIPLFDAERAKPYLGIDPATSRIMPAVLKVTNTGNEPIRVDLQDSSLRIGDNERWATLSLTEAIDRALRSDAHVVGWTIALGLPAWLISADQAAATNQTLEQDYHAKYFKPTLINAGGTGQGVVFFDVPRKSECRISAAMIRLRKLDTDQPVDVSVPIGEDVLGKK